MAVIREEIGGVDFLLEFDLEGADGEWTQEGETYRTGPYQLTFDRHQPADSVATLSWQLRRTDQQPAVLRKLTVDYQMPLVSFYRLWPTSGIAANNVYIDLPWTIDTVTSASEYDPVLLALNADGLDGTWYSPYQGGQGFGLSRYPQGTHTQLFLPWFTFADEDGNDPAQLRWLTVQGEIATGATAATLSVLENTGGRFAAPPATTAQPVGDARLQVHDCARATLEYRLHGDGADAPAAESSIALRRLLPGTGDCAGQAAVEADAQLTGNWYDPAHAGQGLDLHRVRVNGQALLFGAWYTFDPGQPAGASADQHWFTLQGESDAGDGRIETTVVQTLGGRFDGQATDNHHRVGSATLDSADCRHLTLDYRFDDDPVAGAFRGLSGRLQLARLGACPAPQR